MRVWSFLFLMVCFALADAQIVDSINNPPQWMVWNTENSDIPYDFVTDIDLDSKGNVWMGFCTPFFGGGGFGRLTMPNDWLHFDRNNFSMFGNRIEYECVSALQINENDSIFLCLNNSPTVAIISENEYKSLINCGTSYENANRVYLKDKLIYVVASSGFYAYQDSCIHYIRLPEYKRVFSLAFDRNDKMYIGVESQGIFYYEDSTFKFLTLPPSSLSYHQGLGRVSAMLFENQPLGGKERLWFAFWSSWDDQYSGVGVWDGDSLVVYNKEVMGTLESASVWVEQDRKGRIWVCTRNGLAIFDNGRWTAYNYGTSFLPHPNVKKVVFDRWGNGWISTNGGLAVFNPDGLLFGEPEHVFRKTDITLYPVPATDFLNMRFRAEKDGQISTLIRDLHGQLIRTYPPQNILHGDNILTLDLTGLPPGMLLIEVRSATQNFVYRMVKL